MVSFTIQGKNIDVYPAVHPGKPVIYLNTLAFQGRRVYRELQKGTAMDHTLVTISHLEWDHDMAPWDIPPISKHDTPCTGGADDYLHILTQEIVPEAEKYIDGKPAWRGITGYSLAGLFAVYAIYQTDMFSRAASMSGSLWFPEFKEYIFSHDMKIRPDRMYFSLGIKECETKNPYLKTVKDNTGEIQAFFDDQGIDSVFQLNPGNHYNGGAKRTAAGIDWILKR